MTSSTSSLLDKYKEEYPISCENGDSNRKLVKILQDLATRNFDQINAKEEMESLLKSLWDNSVLLEDCILVSGIIFAKLYPQMNYFELCQRANVDSLQQRDWVSLALMRGIFLNTAYVKTIKLSTEFEELIDLTVSSIFTGIINNRIVFVSRHLENLLFIYTAELSMNLYNPNTRGNQIISIINKTLLLKSDLTDYKSRDLIKWHLNVLTNLQQNFEEKIIKFSEMLLDSLPEATKISISIYLTLGSFEFQSASVKTRIFELCLPCLK